MQKHHGKIALTAGSALLVGFGAGVLITLPFAATKVSPQYDVGFKAGFEDARLKLAQSGVLPPEQKEMTSVSGKLISINGNILQIQTDPVIVNPLDPPAPVDRTILLTPGTTISRLVKKSPDVFNEEQSVWMATFSKRKPTDAPVFPPLPTIEEKIAITDIKPGLRLTITADQNIKMLQKFEAKTVVQQ